MPKSHLSITQAGITALFVTVVGQLVAFIPSFGPDKQALISAGSTIIAAVFMLANAGHKIADSNVSVQDVRAGAIDAARVELTKVNFGALVKNAVDSKSIPDLESKVHTEVQRIMSGLLGQAAAQPPAGPLAVTAPPASAFTSDPPAVTTAT